ncbi:hypothetical protein BDA96_02G349900 [Sorghum bicolor]|uniref:Uncharacterized protein n=1 Tax=Sorghum bicolor TaxID=4558 RepID=A0A921UVT1_SORBI|nr:hypothetical protein BDA96_02G349900 [Sorghum bicolor]
MWQEHQCGRPGSRAPAAGSRISEQELCSYGHGGSILASTGLIHRQLGSGQRGDFLASRCSRRDSAPDEYDGCRRPPDLAEACPARMVSSCLLSQPFRAATGHGCWHRGQTWMELPCGRSSSRPPPASPPTSPISL